MLIAIEKKHSPESASSEGLSEYDEKISAATHEDDVAETSETRAVLAKFQEQLPKEQDKYVRQDLEIMIHSTQLNLKQHDFAETHQIPYINASGAVYQGLRVLLDDQVAAERRPSAVVRLPRDRQLSPTRPSSTSMAHSSPPGRAASRASISPMTAPGVITRWCCRWRRPVKCCGW